jgi:AcrR family transcriptional regulator
VVSPDMRRGRPNVNPSPETSSLQTFTVQEMAARLGVSERTVYRRIRSGKIRRIISSVSRVSNVRLIPDNPDQSSTSQAQNCVVPVSSVSDTLAIELQSRLEALESQLQQKDGQIEKLLDNQFAMTQTIQALQAQVGELTRLLVAKHDTQSLQRGNAMPDDRSSRSGTFRRLIARIRPSRKESE